MKAKKTVAMVVILMGLFGVFAPGARAARGWYTCTIDSTGVGAGSCTVALTAVGGAFTSRWFTLPPDYQNQFMAVMLTAMTNDMYLVVYTEPAQDSVIISMFAQYK